MIHINPTIMPILYNTRQIKLPLIWIFSIIRSKSQIISLIIGRYDDNELCWTEAFSYFRMEIKNGDSFQRYYLMFTFHACFSARFISLLLCDASKTKCPKWNRWWLKSHFSSLDSIAFDRDKILVIKSLDNMLLSMEIFSKITDFPTMRSI